MINATYIAIAVLGGLALAADLNSTEHLDSIEPNNTAWRRAVIKLCMICLTAMTCADIIAGALQ